MSKQTFENALKKLEKIVEELENGELPLERAVKKFEEGIKLSAYCGKMLDETEQRIHLLLQEADGRVREVPFEQAEKEAEKE